MNLRSRPPVLIDHYIGIDVGTGSARACVVNSNGDIVGLDSEEIGLWQPQQGYYVSTTIVLFPPFLLTLIVLIPHITDTLWTRC